MWFLHTTNGDILRTSGPWTLEDLHPWTLVHCGAKVDEARWAPTGKGVKVKENWWKAEEEENGPRLEWKAKEAETSPS